MFCNSQADITAVAREVMTAFPSNCLLLTHVYITRKKCYLVRVVSRDSAGLECCCFLGMHRLPVFTEHVPRQHQGKILYVDREHPHQSWLFWGQSCLVLENKIISLHQLPVLVPHLKETIHLLLQPPLYSQPWECH